MATDANVNTLPDPLPHPLDDPLRWYRKVIGWLLIPMFLATLAMFCLPRLGGADWPLVIRQVDALLTFVIVLSIWRLLPRREPDALYLRSFRNDSAAYPIRTEIARTLGSTFRLAGIRDPRRRWPRLVRHLIYLLFLLHYCRPRFMNLEAGNDWKARLWRSLGDARCAMIDVTDLTPFVLDEIRLAAVAMGPARTLLVVDTTRDPDQWRREIAAQCGGAVSAADCHVAVWEPTRSGRKSFATEVRRFAAQLPPGKVGLSAAAWPLALEQQPLDERSGGRNAWAVEFGLAVLVSVALFWLISRFEVLAPTLTSGVLVAANGLLLYLLMSNLAKYLLEFGSFREWFVTGLLYGFFGLVAIPLVMNEWRNPPEGIRGAAARMASFNNLKQIGLAFAIQYDSEQLVTPAQVYTSAGRPHVSWRVLLLPELGEPGLFAQYRLDEPWDSPANQIVRKQIPLVFRAPQFFGNDDPTTTPYRVFVGSGAPLDAGPGGDRLFRQLYTGFGASGVVPLGTFGKPLDFARVPRRSELVLVVESKQRVPWTQPDELDVASFPFADPHSVLGLSTRGFQAALADGTVRLFERSQVKSADEWRRILVGDNLKSGE